MTDMEQFVENFDSYAINIDNVWEVTDFLLEKCPVAHGNDAWGEFWVASKYNDVYRILQDWRTFESSKRARVPIIADELDPPEMPPIDVNPPFHRQVRELLNPYLTPQKVTEYEPATRKIVDELIDGFIDDGYCDISEKLFQPLPPTLLFRLLLSIEDDEELRRARHWLHELSFEQHKKDVSQSQFELGMWLFGLVAARTDAERRDDLIDALVHGTVEDGRSLTPQEMIGVLVNLLIGGFLTTTDATSSFLARLIEAPELQRKLRADPSLLPKAIEEHLRLMPPVPIIARVCAQESEIRGAKVKVGDRVAWNVAAANRDSDEFERPNEFDMDRERNRHFAFGGGVHRCVGSNFARMSACVLFEQLLSRLDDIRVADGESIRPAPHGSRLWYQLESIPVAFSRR